MATPKLFVMVRVDLVRAAIRALDYKAHDEAGHSTDEDAFEAESTADYEIARMLEELLLKGPM